MSVFSNPASSTPTDIAAYTAGLLQLLGDNDSGIILQQTSKEALEAVAMSSRDVFIVSRRKTNGFFGFPNNFIEKEFGVSATSRNWSTIITIVELVKSGADG